MLYKNSPPLWRDGSHSVVSQSAGGALGLKGEKEVTYPRWIPVFQPNASLELHSSTSYPFINVSPWLFSPQTRQLWQVICKNTGVNEYCIPVSFSKDMAMSSLSLATPWHCFSLVFGGAVVEHAHFPVADIFCGPVLYTQSRLISLPVLTSCKIVFNSRSVEW